VWAPEPGDDRRPPIVPEARGSAGQAKDGTGGVTGRIRGWRDCAGLVESGSSQTGALTGLRHSGILAPFMVDQPARSRTAIAATSANTVDKRRCAASAVSAVQPMPPRSMAASISTRWKRKLS
jgi:hypothetical protein